MKKLRKIYREKQKTGREQQEASSKEATGSQDYDSYWHIAMISNAHRYCTLSRSNDHVAF